MKTTPASGHLNWQSYARTIVAPERRLKGAQVGCGYPRCECGFCARSL